MYYIRFEVRPTPGGPHAANFGGAYANCWIRDRSAPSLVHAERRARETVAAEGWTVFALEDSANLNRDEVPDESLECHDEAIALGESYFFDIWPRPHVPDAEATD